MNTKPHFLDYFFNPDSIAVVGATANTESLNYNLFGNLIKFKYQGRMYPVNPNTKEILGIKTYPDLADINDQIDLVVTAVPAERTLDVVRSCVEKKVKGVVIVAGGFSEIGGDGVRLQDTIATMLKQNGIRATGPNTLSPINSHRNLIISFHTVDYLRRGNVSFIFQSGMYDPRLNWLFSTFHLGVNKILDLGNKMDVNEVDALEYLSQDETTKVIAIHMETIKGDSKRFIHILQETTKNKPVIILKSGRTPAGARAAMSHTASIIQGNDVILDSVFKQTGVLRAQNLDELFNFAKAFDYLGRMNGNRCMIAPFAGGEGVIAADLCEQEGLRLAESTPEMKRSLQKIFPPWDIPVNPLDLGVCVQFNQPEKMYDGFFETIIESGKIDCVFMHPPSLGFIEPSEEVIRSFIMTREKGIPLVIWRVLMADQLLPVIEVLESHSIPVFRSMAEAIKAVSAVYHYSEFAKTPG